MAELFAVPNTAGTRGSQSDALSPDWEARRDALDIQQSWIVEAPAGSGKTALLIQRFLKLLADDRVTEPEQVLAITFTVKATTEMRDRVTEQLHAASRPDTSKNAFERETRALAEAVLRRDKQLGWQLLDHPRRLNVRTIHSVCGEIARSLPVLSGSGARLSPVEHAASLYTEAARRTLMQLGGADAALNEALRTLLLHRDGNLADCENLLVEILALRDQWGEFIPLSGAALDETYLNDIVRPRLQHTFEQITCAALEGLASALPPDVLHELAMLAGEMGHTDGYKGRTSPIAICAGIHTAPHETVEHLQLWRALIHLLTTKEGKWRAKIARNFLGFKIEEDHKQRLEAIVAHLRDRDDLLEAIARVSRLPPVKYSEEQWAVAKSLFRVLSHALVELQLVFAERGECDFAELGLLARTALQRDGAADDLAAALGMKFQHLLVDEMQDTSTSEYELIELLTQGWDGHSQTVFLVGDPKQSIYLFRQARVERFVRTVLHSEFGDLPIGRLRLTANFRSQSGLVTAFNKSFSQLFPREVSATNPEDVPYMEAASVRTATAGVRGFVWHPNVLAHALPDGPPGEAKQRQAKADAQAIRAIIEQWRALPLPDGRVKPWSIAVLVRNRSHLVDIIAALKKGAIPYRAVEIEPLGERQEVLDLFALTRALLHPADRVAWLATLRAPWCGLGLAELHLLVGADDHTFAKRALEDLIAERGHLLGEESCQRLSRLWPVLQAAATQLSQTTTAECVERAWRSLGGDAYLKKDQLVNARRYLQLLDELEEQTGTVDLSLLKERMSRLFAAPQADVDAVDLMTIHGAKGLEWDVVIVPGLERLPRQDRMRLLTWDEIGPSDQHTARIVLAPVAGKGEGSKALNKWLKSIHSTREAAERKRLFYVACTRAKEELHLFASPAMTAHGEISRPAGSLLSAAWPAAEEHFMPAEKIDAWSEEEGPALALAAAGVETTAKTPTVHRLPLAFDARARFGATSRLSPSTSETIQGGAYFERPDGSLEARAFGTTVHAFLEMLAALAAKGIAADALLDRVAAWGPRITAVLRAEGLPPNLLERRALEVKNALVNTLRDEHGRWLLTASERASSEYALTAWRDRRVSVRMDRIFRAGDEPFAKGSECLWIIDYKTTAHTGEGMEKFIEAQRDTYAEQMKAYAQMLKTEFPDADIRAGLYYPMLPKLIWWKPLQEASVSGDV